MLPIVSKTWEESFMRQPAAGEKSCAMGDQCECMYASLPAVLVR